MENKILFFSYWYPNKHNPNFAIYVKRHAQAIALKNSIKVLSINIVKGSTIFKKTIEVFKDETGIETHHIYIESNIYKLIYFLLPLHYIIVKKYIEKEIKPYYSFKVLHSNILFPCAIVGKKISKKFNSKHVVTEHWSGIDKFFQKNIYKRNGKDTYDSSDTITVVSDVLKNTIEKYTTNKNILIVPNSIDISLFSYDETIEKNKTFTFIAAAHWFYPKNPFYFLDALNELKQENRISSFKIIIVGNGPLINKIKECYRNLDIEFKGNLNSEELKNELNKAHTFLHGSDYETFSVIIAEALLCGLPSVVSPVGISKDVINEKNGFIANNTVEDWKEKILACNNHNYDRRLISDLIKGKFDLSKVSDMFDAVYKKIVS